VTEGRTQLALVRELVSVNTLDIGPNLEAFYVVQSEQFRGGYCRFGQGRDNRASEPEVLLPSV
jgi:hypothetical protein